MEKYRNPEALADCHRAVVIGASGNTIRTSDHQERVSSKGGLVLLEDPTGNLLEAYRPSLGEQVIVVAASPHGVE